MAQALGVLTSGGGGTGPSSPVRTRGQRSALDLGPLPWCPSGPVPSGLGLEGGREGRPGWGGEGGGGGTQTEVGSLKLDLT